MKRMKFAAWVLMLSLLLSVAWIPAGSAEAPGLLITKVTFGNIARVSITNNLDVAVDSFDIYLLTYNDRGEVVGASRTLSADNYGLAGIWRREETIRPGKSTTQELDIKFLRADGITSVSAFIASYHTVDGYRCDFAPTEFYIVHSDGTVEDPGQQVEPARISDAENEQAAELSFGVSYITVFPQASAYYGVEPGNYVLEVTEGSRFEQAGIRPGDVLESLNGESVLAGTVWERVKLDMLSGARATVTFWRDGELYATEIAQDMEGVASAPVKVSEQANKEAPAGDPAADSWTCPECGAVNTGRFCTDCGASRPESEIWTCPNCGLKNKGNFCPNCGAPR